MQMIDNYNFAGKKAIIRVDFNVPLGAQYEVSDDTRIRGALPTIKKVLQDGGSAILMSHLGRPKSGPEEKFSLKHVIPALSNLLGVEVQFANDCMGEEAVSKSAALKAGEVLLLENLRFYSAENKIKTDEEMGGAPVFVGKNWVGGGGEGVFVFFFGCV
jgi:phosphoglycerate kinase